MTTIKIPEDFNWCFYKTYYKDLTDFTEDQCINHYINHGYKEKRIYKIPNQNFDHLLYLTYYRDLPVNYTKNDCINHYYNHGCTENRMFNQSQIKNIITDHQSRFKFYNLNWKSYLYNNLDLKDNIPHNKISAYRHFFYHGYNDNRFCEFDNDKLNSQKIENEYQTNKFNSEMLPINLDNCSQILINTHSNLNYKAGDTVMITNLMNLLMMNKIHVILILKHEWFNMHDLIFDNFEIKIALDNNDIVANIEQYNNKKKINYNIIRNHEIIHLIKYKPFLKNTILYGLDIHLNSIKLLHNTYYQIWTQSNQIKQKYIDNKVSKDKIHVIEPIVYKYTFQIPERTDNEIRMIYCGTLRDEENILEIIEEFQKIHKKQPEVILKIVYGKIHGNIDFTKKINEYIKMGVKGVTFKHDLSHKESCYEIATSDIGIYWRKNHWGNNGEISTKLKEYKMYNLEIINDMKIKVGVVTSTNKTNKIDNIIKNYKQQMYFNKKLFLVLNNNSINKDDVEKKIIDYNILCEIMIIDEKFNLGYCLNQAIENMKTQNYDIFSKFDDDDIYEKKYLLEQIFHLNKTKCEIVGKYDTIIYQSSKKKISKIKNFSIQNDFTDFCRGSTITFNIHKVKTKFDELKLSGVDSLFIKEKKIYCTSNKNYFWVRSDNQDDHTWKIDIDKEFSLEELDGNILCDDSKNNLFPDNELSVLPIKVKNNLDKKIYLILWEDENNSTKGINIDCEIIYNTLIELNYNVSFLKIPLLYLKNFNSLNNSILLDADIYIFSEICQADIYDFILFNKKEIICIPNIDSYSTYKPIIYDRETDFINNLKEYSKNNKFSIWCKTKQIYNWLKKYSFENLHYIHFCYNISIISNKCENYNEIDTLFNTRTEYLLLDTGSSTTKRKYLEEILTLFIENKNIPFTLLVKTVPKVYNRFIKNTKYENSFDNIIILNEVMSLEKLTYLYKKCKYFIYCSKFDGYGLSLSQAIKYNLFIFTLNGLPWSELLESYPRKCLINCETDLSKSMGILTKGKALSQIYYKADFSDLKYKLINNQEKYQQTINETQKECEFINYYNHTIFLSNIKYFFQKKYKICSIYNNSVVGVVSYVDRESIFIENLMNMILQTNKIFIYLNSSTNLIRTFLSNISNIQVKFLETDYKSLSKLLLINNLNSYVNIIIDDDIIYPSDYVEYTYNILQISKDNKTFYSYNGFSDNFKYPFTIKTKLCTYNGCNLGSGTLFYNKDTVDHTNLEIFNKNLLSLANDDNIKLFCDKTLLNYCKENNIKTKIISPKHSYWMKNNPKMTHGLLETKKIKGIYDLENIRVIPMKDTVNNYNNSISVQLQKRFNDKILFSSKFSKKNYNLSYDEEQFIFISKDMKVIKKFKMTDIVDIVQYISMYIFQNENNYHEI